MRQKRFRMVWFAVFLTTMAFCTVNAYAQCVIPITDGASYTENFESGTMECWTVEASGNATWAVMNGTASNVVAFQNASLDDEARLISPTFDLSGVSGAYFSFGYAMLGFYESDLLTVSYRTSESDSWHELGSYSFSDWANTYDETFELPELSATLQVSFLGHSYGGYYIFIDDIEIMSAGGCARPMNLEVNNITAFSAMVDWSTTGNEEHWILEVNNQQKTVDVHPFLLEGLEPGTENTVRVKANCGDGMESEWSYPMTFKTRCDVIAVTDDQPYFDDFEASEDFVCWYNEIASGIDGWVVDPGYTIPNNTAFFIWLGGEARLISAPLDITEVSHPALSFKHKQPHGDMFNADELSVWYATSTSDYWHLLGEYTEITDSWITETYALPEPSATYYICFKAKANDANGVYVDDVWVGNNQSVGLDDVTEAEFNDGDVVIYDLYGRRVASAGLAKGVYVVRITSDKGVTTKKIIKE